MSYKLSAFIPTSVSLLNVTRCVAYDYFCRFALTRSRRGTLTSCYFLIMGGRRYVSGFSCSAGKLASMMS
ncbi:hypothetical protein J6590_015017 [Homalodisca vitripennis]|nr:hypothetical protein J6590_015017 [Homalodisca vitripennis]